MSKIENRKLLFRISLISLAILMLFFLFIQSSFSQIFRTLFYEYLVYNRSYQQDGMIYNETMVNLSALKLLLTAAFIFLVIFVAVLSYLISRRAVTMEVKKLSEKIPKFLKTENVSTTGDLSLDNELLKIKAENTKNEELLKRETQRTKDMITYLAHDLKTPLASVIGYLNLLIDSPELTTAQRAKYQQITLDKAGRLEELINEFFDITRFSLQEIHLYKTRMDLVLLSQQMIEEFYPLLSDKNQEISFEGPESLSIEADSEQLARVFNNLLKNALTYGNPDSVIQMELREAEFTIKLLIKNEGPTIPKRQLEMIFDKFYRLDHARSAKTGGAGLGLAIAKEIVTAHGGKISAGSENSITTFEVILPKS
ncbi:HAMP domain-containing histidine kinase [Enterococcus sp. BWT-B8]|uniref:sensor histidine kinase n=1 Tax=Enterococcus sp. BWT-B8 TaxID=2885157 RepID=UPI001E43B997|nr:HAMP domain-containing sensor histidine kinase [Enterococcus sp. BWT-B8]MCB5953354.1 HAMP domain-containing histidine kinase [Enterococcus sp. BWT-B8]